jgi:hypothetical protein
MGRVSTLDVGPKRPHQVSGRRARGHQKPLQTAHATANSPSLPLVILPRWCTALRITSTFGGIYLGLRTISRSELVSEARSDSPLSRPRVVPHYSTIRCGTSTNPRVSTQGILHNARRISNVQTLENVVVRSVFWGVFGAVVDLEVAGSSPVGHPHDKPTNPGGSWASSLTRLGGWRNVANVSRSGRFT